MLFSSEIKHYLNILICNSNVIIKMYNVIIFRSEVLNKKTSKNKKRKNIFKVQRKGYRTLKYKVTKVELKKYLKTTFDNFYYVCDYGIMKYHIKLNKY